MNPSSSLSQAAMVRTLTELDHARLAKFTDAGRAVDPAMQDLLDNAELVSPTQVDPDVVTMRSRVRVAELSGKGERELTLSYPFDADASDGRVSVLSPVGTALLGLRVGEVARWTAPDGSSAALRVTAMAFQPEASGDYLL